MVPRAGIEPARYFYRGILSPLRLPISPPGLYEVVLLQLLLFSKATEWQNLEAEVGIEPALTDLQSAA